MAEAECDEVGAKEDRLLVQPCAVAGVVWVGDPLETSSLGGVPEVYLAK